MNYVDIQLDNMPRDNPVYMLVNESESTSVVDSSLTQNGRPREKKQDGDEEERSFVNKKTPLLPLIPGQKLKPVPDEVPCGRQPSVPG